MGRSAGGARANWPHSRSRSPLVRCLVALVAPSVHCALRPRLLAMGPAWSPHYSSFASGQPGRVVGGAAELVSWPHGFVSRSGGNLRRAIQHEDLGGIVVL